MQNITQDKPIEVELFVWMKQVTAKNNGKKYYEIGNVKAIPHTVLVTLIGGNGGAVMFCQTHSFAYPIKGSCDECRNAVVSMPGDALATTCGKPEIERN